MTTFGIFIAYILFQQKYGRLPQEINGVSFQIHDGRDLGERWGKRLRFGVDLYGYSSGKGQLYLIKIEERELGKFTVGVYSKETDSIQYNLNVRFSLYDPIERLIQEFPGNRYIEQFVESLTNSKPTP